MALNPNDVTNFETLKKAFRNDDVALMECTDAKTGEYRAVICMVHKDGADYQITPVCHMPASNPFDLYVEPTA
jgi:predicted GTPase